MQSGNDTEAMMLIAHGDGCKTCLTASAVVVFPSPADALPAYGNVQAEE
jgi:hypothetical protein